MLWTQHLVRQLCKRPDGSCGRWLIDCRSDCGIAGRNPDERYGKWCVDNFNTQQRFTLRNHRRLWEVFGARQEEVQWGVSANFADTPVNRQLYESAEARARAERVGLWSAPNPVPHWEWRHPENRPPTAVHEPK